MAGLVQHHSVRVGVKPHLGVLFSDLAAVCAPGDVGDAEVAVLLKPALRAVLEAIWVPRRVGQATDWRGPLLTDVVVGTGGHRLDDYGACVELLEAKCQLPAVRVVPASESRVVLMPLSASGPGVEWPGFRRLADLLVERGHGVVFAAGPGEEDRLRRIAGRHPVLPTLGLMELAAILAGAPAVVGNDSGLTHLAAAARRGAGRGLASVVGVAGSTSPQRTGAPGATWLDRAGVPCRPCYSKGCGVPGVPCLDVPVAAVGAAVMSQLGDGVRP